MYVHRMAPTTEITVSVTVLGYESTTRDHVADALMELARIPARSLNFGPNGALEIVHVAWDEECPTCHQRVTP